MKSYPHTYSVEASASDAGVVTVSSRQRVRWTGALDSSRTRSTREQAGVR